MVKKKIFRKMRKFFILPLFILCLFSCILCVNADSLIYQSNPFIIQGTATDNGESIADVSPVAFLFEKRGHSEVVNNEIVNADGQYLVNIGRQQWDEEWEVGTYYYVTGEKVVGDNNTIRCKNRIKIIGGTTYYAKFSNGTMNIVGFFDNEGNWLANDVLGLSNSETFTTPINATEMVFAMSSVYGTSYNDDITISLYYEDEDGYDEYYPYEVVSYVDTGNELLRSAGSVYDVKIPDGTITRNIGSYTFTGDEVWNSNDQGYYCNWSYRSIALGYSSRVIPNVLSSVLSPVAFYDLVNGVVSSGITIDVDGFITIGSSDYSNINSLTGSTLYFELKESTTEQGTSYSQNYYVDDFGSQYWLDENMELVEVGQAGLYGYNFDFVYSWYDNIVRMIVAPIKSLGGSIVNFVKTGFVQLFTTQEVVNDVVLYHASPIAWFTFALMGIALAMSLTYFLVNLLRRSK